MKRASIRQVLVLLLAVFFAAGMGKSAVQASDMTAKMSMASDLGGLDQRPCDKCPGSNGDNPVKGVACGGICMAPILAMIPSAVPVQAAHKPVFFSADQQFFQGKTSRPDPYPPRPSEIR